MYRAGKHPKQGRRRKRAVWLMIFALLLIGGITLYNIVNKELQPKTVIKQAAPRTSKAVFETKTKHYEEADFSLDLPNDWVTVPRPTATPYQSYTWRSSDRVTDSEEITIYEDTIPVNFAVNRVLIVSGQQDHLQLEGSVSDNCSTFTQGLSPAAGQVGVPAKWQNISFLCDQFNKQREVVGTSSSDGVNTVLLKTESTGKTHKFFFSYTTHDGNPDYSAFLSALQSFRTR